MLESKEKLINPPPLVWICDCQFGVGYSVVVLLIYENLVSQLNDKQHLWGILNPFLKTNYFKSYTAKCI